MGGIFLLLGLFFAVILLFLPLCFELDVHYQAKEKKLGIAVYLCRFIKIFGGYLDVYPGGIAFHTKRNKVILIPLKAGDGQRKRISIVRIFKISELHVTAEIGAEYIPLSLLLGALLRGYCLFQGGDQACCRSQVWLRNEDFFSITLRVVTKINTCMLLNELLNY